MKLSALLTICSISICFYFNVVLAQGAIQTTNLNAFKERMTPLKAMSEPVDGSPYFNDEWAKAKIVAADGVKIEIEEVKYNAFSRSFEFLKNKQVFTLPQKYEVMAFELAGSSFIRATFKGGKSKDFFQVLSEGKLKLLRRYQCGLIKAQPAEGLIPASNAKYDMREIYYFQINDDPTDKLKLKKDDILTLMKDKSKEVESFIKKEKLKTKKEKDLIKIFNFYNGN